MGVAEKTFVGSAGIRQQLQMKAPSGTLENKSVRILKRRTSVRLEPEMWDALYEIADLEQCTIHDICGAVYNAKEPKTSFTSALRVFMMEYYRSKAKVKRRLSDTREKRTSQDSSILPY